MNRLLSVEIREINVFYLFIYFYLNFLLMTQRTCETTNEHRFTQLYILINAWNSLLAKLMISLPTFCANSASAVLFSTTLISPVIQQRHDMIRDVHLRSRSWFFTHPESRIQRSKRHRIPDPNPQHWCSDSISQMIWTLSTLIIA